MAYPSGISCGSYATVGSGFLAGGGVTSATGLPPGLHFPATVYPADYIDGTPTTAGVFTGTVNGLPVKWVVTAAGAGTIGWSPDGTSPTIMTVGVPSTMVLTPVGPVAGALTFQLYNSFYGSCAPIGGPMPPGLTLGSDGHINGTPTTPGSYQVELVGLDGNYNAPIGGLWIIVNAASGGGALTTTCNSPAAGTVGVAYSTTFGASGGTAPYTFTAISALPAGLTLSSSGVLSGTPSAAGTFTIQMNVTDSAGNGPVALNCSVTIAPAAVVVAPAMMIQAVNLPMIQLPMPGGCR